MLNKILNVIKRYSYLIAIGVLIVFLMLAVSTSDNVVEQTGGNNNSNTNNDDTGNLNGAVPTVSMALPVLDATIAKSFSDDTLQYNATLKQYEAHLGVDFLASAGSKVYAVLDGTVEEVGNTYLHGNYVTIKHDNGIKSVYSSLGDSIVVAKGDRVSKGSIIGSVGSSAYGELEEGNHLHFELMNNENKKIDPAGYLNIGEK